MGANLQFVFYRSEADPEVLVRVMLNEKDLDLPLKSVTGAYFKWKDVYEFYSRKCADVIKNLEKTKDLRN